MQVRLWLFFLAAALLSAPAWADEPIGCLTRTRGEIQVRRGTETIPVVRRLRLRVHDEITLSADGAAEAIHYPSGKRYRLTPGVSVVAPGQLTLATRPPREAKVVSQFPAGSLVPAGAPTPSTTKILGTRGRGLGDALHDPEPLGAVRTTDPLTLQWKNELPQGSGKLLVTVTRVGEREPLVSSELPANAVSFKVPSMLDPRLAYRWEVSGESAKDGLMQTGGTFWFLNDADRRSLEALEQSAADLRRSKETELEADLLLGEGYRNLGLFRLALEQWTRLAAAEPDNPDFAAELRRLGKVVSGRP